MKKAGKAVKMANKNLVIVESPAKAKTIKKYLGSNYAVEASMGHLRDLPKSQMGVDIEHGFEPKYITIRGKGDLVAKLKKQAKNAKKVFLATDPDREGEAISWHLAHILDIDEKSNCRIAFNEITKNAVKNAVKDPRPINRNLVDAQQARRVLDRIVGYEISPILWKKVRKGLSAGRVQSVATRIICDREEEINAFISEEYWSLEALLKTKQKESFTAKFFGKDGKKIDLKTKTDTDEIKAAVEKSPFYVSTVKRGEKKRNPAPPFTTSTMQQEASKKLGFTAKRTMQAAQQLYEGIEIKGHGSVGLITYMRTDSLRISDEARAQVGEYIVSQYGKQYLPEKGRVYKTKKNAQDAHEAIRPTHMEFMPDEIKDSLSSDQYKLYKLIWERFVAAHMESAVFDTIAADIEASGYQFKASGSKIKFEGYMAVYVRHAGTNAAYQKELLKLMKASDSKELNEAGTMLPDLQEGQQLMLEKLTGEQHFTQPPPRYTEATLIKTMEEKGIGRPSTYAPTITTILARGYIEREKKALLPTELGVVINSLMKEYFKEIVDVAFTANMEEKLDKVEDGEENWVELLRTFYGPFDKTLKEAMEQIGDIEIKDEETDIPCEKCGRMMVIKQGRYGKFLACPGFPECRNAKPILKDTGVACPKCGGKILEKKSKRGKKYFGCENNPVCDYMSWDEPTKEKCPKCGGILYKKWSKTGAKLRCANEECKYERALKD